MLFNYIIKAKRILPIFILVCLPSISYANFGLGPCCPPSVCGIIPCDSGCAGAAINQMGTNISSGFNNLSSAHQDLTSAVQDAIDAMTDLGTDVNDALMNQNSDLMDGLSASTAKIELSNNVATKSLERLADHSISSLVNALKEIEIARSTSENNRLFGDNANPVSGETGANQAIAIKTLNTQFNQILISSTEEFVDYVNDENSTSSGAGNGQHRMQSLTMLADNDRLDRILTSRVLEGDEFQSLQLLIGLAVSKYPLVEDKSILDETYNLRRKREISLLAMTYSGLLNASMSKVGLVDASWADYYQDANTNQSGDTSLIAFYEADINGRLTDPEWWGSILRLNQIGLQREKTYQTAVSGHLKVQLDNLSSSSNDLLALILAKKQEAKAEGLSGAHKSL